jgi:hypothetical protein
VNNDRSIMTTAFIKSAIEAGLYNNLEAVVREAIRVHDSLSSTQPSRPAAVPTSGDAAPGRGGGRNAGARPHPAAFTVTKVGKWMDWGGMTLMLSGGAIGSTPAGVEFNSKFQPELESIANHIQEGDLVTCNIKPKQKPNKWSSFYGSNLELVGTSQQATAAHAAIPDDIPF